MGGPGLLDGPIRRGPVSLLDTPLRPPMGTLGPRHPMGNSDFDRYEDEDYRNNSGPMERDFNDSYDDYGEDYRDDYYEEGEFLCKII